MKNILIFGSGGHAKVVVDIVEQQKEYLISGFIDVYSKINQRVLGYKVLGDESSLKAIISDYKISGGVIGINDNFIRSEVRNKIVQVNPGFKFINCIHPKSVISKYVTIGEGNVVMANATINTSTIIKNHCIVNTNASIDHDSLMSNFSSIAPNATIGGNVSIGNYSAIGISSCIFQNVTIGDNCIVGGGSLVCKNTLNNSIYYQSPAKFIRAHKLGEKYLK
jgi:sugar O-acyltransferase (sialic acid O-acetyltransferase NeuD family)